MVEIIKKNIPMKDVAKVMREVGYNKASVDGKKGSNIEDQLAEANKNAKSAPTMADAVNRAIDAVSPPPATPIVLRPGEPVVKAVTPDPKSKVVKKKEKPKAKPVEDFVDEEDDIREPKLVVIDMSDIRTEVTFTGEGWKLLDIKLAYVAMVRAFRIKIRDEYRKGIK